jgi:hypothetical protein
LNKNLLKFPDRSRRTSRAPLVTRVEEGWNAYGVYVGKPEGLEDISIDWRILLKLILKKYDGRVLTGLIWLGIGTNGGLL